MEGPWGLSRGYFGATSVYRDSFYNKGVIWGDKIKGPF